MKVFKHYAYEREYVIVLDKVIMVQMGATTGWITMQGNDRTLEVNKWVAEGLIKALEEGEQNDNY